MREQTCHLKYLMIIFIEGSVLVNIVDYFGTNNIFKK